jgi:protein-S-isoprenylcysteine O-methyltransferase Ste14
MRWLELKIPPPLVALLIGVAMWAIARASWHVQIAPNVQLTTSIALAVLGVVVAVLSSMAFKRVGTTVNPLKPDAASVLVTSGVYRHTRNPMYVGLATVLLGWAMYLGAPLAIVGPVAFVAYITRFQIIPEERVLSIKFGGEFAEYQARVRRWL